MSKTFLKRVPLLEDGAFPLRPSFQQLREGRGRESFLRDPRDGGVATALDAETHIQQGPKSFLRRRRSEQIVRRHGLPDNVTSFQPRTIPDPTPLSTGDTKVADFSPETQRTKSPNFVQQRTKDGYKLVPVTSAPSLQDRSTCTMALPPHLRKKKVQTPATSTGQSEQVEPGLPSDGPPAVSPAATAAVAVAIADAAAAAAVAETPATVEGAASTFAYYTNVGESVEPDNQPAKQPQTDDIRAKLESLGAKVSDPSPGRPSLVPYSESTEYEDTMARKRVVKTQHKATEDQHAIHATKFQGDQPVLKRDAKVVQSSPHGMTRSPGEHSLQVKPDPKAKQSPPHESGRGSGRGRGRGRGRGGFGSSQARESRWPTAAEQRADPHRWDIRWDDEESRKMSTISDFESVCADDGGARGKRNKRGKAGGNQEHQLADYSGGWAPPPVDWDSRPGFRNNQSAEQIEKWQTAVADEICAPHGYSALPSSELQTWNDLAPRYWVPTSFGKESVVAFWNKITDPDNMSPKCYHEGDLVGVQPWWLKYQSVASSALQAYPHPYISGVDPNESRDERLARENDRGSHFHAENRKRTELAKKEAKRQLLRKAQDKTQKIRKTTQRLEVVQRIKVGVDLYIRGALAEDIESIRTIYNHYVTYSTCTSEVESLSADQILEKLHRVRESQLPFLVACERGAKIRVRKNRNEDGPVILPDKVVGFGVADEYLGSQGMYRLTAKLEIYIASHSLGKNIAKCLADKLLGLLDSGYVESGGYDVEGDEAEGIGPSRVVNNLIINLPYDRPETFERKKRWITEGLRFGQVGNLEGIGERDGKRYRPDISLWDLSKANRGYSVSLAIFQRKTGLVFSDASPTFAMDPV